MEQTERDLEQAARLNTRENYGCGPLDVSNATKHL